MASQEVNFELKALKVVSKLLKNKIFSGVYKERRLIEVDSVAAYSYNDVIVVDKSEDDFISNLRKVNEFLQDKCRGLLKTPISVSTSQYLLMTDLRGVALGPHWFQIKGIYVNRNLIHLKVKSLRPLNSVSSSPMSEKSSIDLKNIWDSLSDIMSKKNLIASVRFLMIVLLALIVGLYHLLLLLIRLVHELNFLIRSLIPFFIVCVESLTKAFGGVLILIAMMWRNSKTIPKNHARESPYYKRPLPPLPPPPSYKS